MNGHGPFPELVVRPVGPDDADRLRRFFGRLSAQTVYRRFFTLFPAPPPAVLGHLLSAHGRDHESLAVLDGGEIVAVAGWDRLTREGESDDERDSAEIAVLVEDAWQHRGLGRTLVGLLTGDAARHGINVIIATVLSENGPARRLATGLARPERIEMEGPATYFTFRLAS